MQTNLDKSETVEKENKLESAFQLMFILASFRHLCQYRQYFYKSNIKYLSTNVHYYFKMQNYG